MRAVLALRSKVPMSIYLSVIYLSVRPLPHHLTSTSYLPHISAHHLFLPASARPYSLHP